MSETIDLEADLCRCCHSQGGFDNLAVPQNYLEVVEIYSDMLKDCFNIEINPVPGELCERTYKICKACIKKLRNAINFRKQVKNCEERFLEMYYKNRIKVLNSTAMVIVKEESQDLVIDETVFKEEESQIDNNEGAEDYHFSGDEKDDLDSSEDELSVLKKNTSDKAVKTDKRLKKPGRPRRTDDVKQCKKERQKRTSSKFEEHYTSKDSNGSPLYICNICSNSYKTIACFKQHYRHVHLKQRPKLIGCYYCTEKVSAHMRASHLEKVHGVPAPSCGACGKKFSYPFQVLRHQKTYHMGEKKFTCKICDKSFATRGNLAQHEVKHSSERPFKCDFCEETFKWKKHVRRHVLMHMNRKS